MSHWYFAWTGSDPIPALTIATTGDVWGGSRVYLGSTWNGQLSTTADAFVQQVEHGLTNIRNPEALQSGGTYHIDGPGLINNRGVFDGVDRIELTNPPNPVGENISVVISTPGDEIFRNHGFGNQTTFFLFTDIVRIYDPSGLAIGQTYLIAGKGIPANAFFVYQGGNDITLQNYGDPTNPFDTTQASPGATETGANVELTITLNEGLDIISNVADTSELTVGDVVQVFGKGIPDAALATYLGGGQFQLSKNATSTEIGTFLRLYRDVVYPDGGPFVEEDHARNDEIMFSVSITQAEGDFALAALEVKNPRIGLIAPGRNLWCWLSYQRTPTSPIVPMLHGRLLAAATNIAGEKVTFNFLASPGDYDAQRILMTEALKEPPFYAAEWFDNGIATPDTILEARAAFWDTNRSSLAVTVTDAAIGEAGTLEIDTYEFDGSEHLYGETSVDVSSAPVNGIYVNAAAQFTQEGTGTVNLSDGIVAAFGGKVSSYCGDGLASSWPKVGQSVGEGWTVGDGTHCTKIGNVASPTMQSHLNTGQLSFIDSLKDATSITTVSSSTPPSSTNDAGANITSTTVTFPLNFFSTNLYLNWEAKREWTENVSFFLEADVQSIISDSRSHTETLNLSTSGLRQPIGPNGTYPLYDSRSNTFFKTDYGKNVSFPFLIQYAKARLKFKARAITIEVTVPLWKVLDISCRHNVHVIDYRIPGGQATGKVISYALTSTGGREAAKIKIGCMIGRGGTITTDSSDPGIAAVAATPGTGCYVQPGYFVDDASAEVMIGARKGIAAVEGSDPETVITEGASTVTYPSFDELDIVDDGVNLFDMRAETVVTRFKLIMPPAEQLKVIAATRSGVNQAQTLSGFITTAIASVKPDIPKAPADALKNAYTEILIELVPLTGSSFISDFAIDVSKLQLPKTIDLKAPSNA